MSLMKSKELYVMSYICYIGKREFDTDKFDTNKNDKNEFNTYENNKIEFNTDENDEKDFNTYKINKSTLKLYDKVKDHCHYTEKFGGAANNICTLR